MKLRKRNAFTLIELIATLVIMAIIALIATPLVMNIIRSARISADKRSIDAYGRSIELAIASHLLDTGKFATSIDELTIEYSGDTVTCEITQINPDSSVYLSGCKVKNRDVTNYTYGTDKSPSYESYQVGDHVSYNGVTYYVIEDSGTKNNVVKLLKENPLTYTEINALNLDGIDVNYFNAYGVVSFYKRVDCVAFGDTSGCKNDYVSSDIKKIVDQWADMNLNKSDVKQARLIDSNEIETESEERDCCGGCGSCIYTADVAIRPWIYNSDYSYWTMTKKDLISVKKVSDLGVVGFSEVTQNGSVRPVVELYKTATITKLES